jgi:hypothetical protein
LSEGRYIDLTLVEPGSNKKTTMKGLEDDTRFRFRLQDFGSKAEGTH